MLKEMLENVRDNCPLVHNITNYVTVNDVANALLAIGGSPIMSDDEGEVEEITSICSALNINIGTLNKNTIPSMLLAGKKSNLIGHPVLLDPVGAGASTLRTETAKKLINDVYFAVIRGNVSEIKALADGSGSAKGVDADIADKVTEDNLSGAVSFAKAFARKTGAIIAITGAIDIVTDGESAYAIRNGRPEMGRITGTGCMLSGITAAFISANPDAMLTAVVAATAAMGVAGDMAFKRMSEHDGNSSYRNYIIDELFNMTGDVLEKNARVEAIV